MDIWCSEEGYEVNFYIPDDKQPDEIVFNDLRKNVKSLNGFSDVLDEKCDITKSFDFSDETGLYSFIDSLLIELSKMKKG